MLKRPKNTDTMDDVLEMQQEYTKEVNKAPAAQVVSMKTKSGSIFSRQRNIQKQTESNWSKVSVIRDVVERKYNENDISLKSEEMQVDCGFPEVMNIECTNDESENVKSKESLFVKLMKNSQDYEGNKFESNTEDVKKSIDNDNLKLLETMDPSDILRERDKLLKSMDPNLIKFITQQRKSKNHDTAMKDVDPVKSKKTEDISNFVKSLPTQELLEEVSANSYVNMNIVEPDKLEWLKDMEKIQSIPKDKKYEARFDFKGFLLPYIFDEQEHAKKDNRELYCHEDECHRPGYSLQELFRLARAEVLQQRVSAILAISGILNIYMQGFYDGIIDLPISKIFFFLRFGLDENTPVIIEACIKSLSNLFYNEIDEMLLDLFFETNLGHVQPLIQNEIPDYLKQVEESFGNINLSEANDSRLFESNVDTDLLSDHKQEKENITDFHLAEINLVECLERTNIIERISYIMLAVNGSQNTNISCLKLLIRLARTSEKYAEKIAQKKNLMDHLLSEKVLSMDKPNESEMAIKLFRIIAAYNVRLLSKLTETFIIDKLTAFISLQNDMNFQYIKLQIESFRFFRLYFKTIQNEGQFNAILMPLRYLLEWHLHNLDFYLKNHFICRIHASALLYLIQCSNINITYTLFGETFKICCKKWYQRASTGNLEDMSQKILLSCVLDVSGTFIKVIPEFFYDFIDEYLLKFLSSNSFKNMLQSLTIHSVHLNDFVDRRFTYKPLTNLGSIVRKRKNPRDVPKLIYSKDYSAYFVHSLLLFIALFNNPMNEINFKIFEKMKNLFFAQQGIEKYLDSFSMLTETSFTASNWFGQIEIKLIYNLIKMGHFQEHLVYKTAFNLVLNLSCDKFLLVLDIFDNIIFHEDFVRDMVSKEELQQMKYMYNGLVMSKIKERKCSYISMNEGWNEILLKNTWVFELLLIFLHNTEQSSNDVKHIETDLTEEQIIMNTLKFKRCLNAREINIIALDEQLMFLMLIYLGKDLNFLNESVKQLLRAEFEKFKGKIFKFNMRLNNEKDFESLYKLFLETFQAQSYADDLFSSFVMIPLMLKYNISWRNIVWSEYAMVLRFITCQGYDLLYSIDDYLNPIETDELLLKSYRNALKYLRKDSLPWIIATHHLSHSNL